MRYHYYIGKKVLFMFPRHVYIAMCFEWLSEVNDELTVAVKICKLCIISVQNIVLDE